MCINIQYEFIHLVLKTYSKYCFTNYIIYKCQSAANMESKVLTTVNIKLYFLKCVLYYKISSVDSVFKEKKKPFCEMCYRF